MDRRVVFVTGTVITRQAHAKLHHRPALRGMSICRPAARWELGASFGVLITDGPRLVEKLALVARLLVPQA